VAQPDERDRALGPEAAEADFGAVLIGQDDVGEFRAIHRAKKGNRSDMRIGAVIVLVALVAGCGSESSDTPPKPPAADLVALERDYAAQIGPLCDQADDAFAAITPARSNAQLAQTADAWRREADALQRELQDVAYGKPLVNEARAVVLPAHQLSESLAVIAEAARSSRPERDQVVREMATTVAETGKKLRRGGRDIEGAPCGHVGSAAEKRLLPAFAKYAD
jgi:hypothetical protein